MTAVASCVIGSYPVTVPTSELMASYFQGEEVSWKPYIADAVGDMVDAGLDLVSDGQTRDPFVQLVTRKLDGCRVRARTEVVGPIEYREFITVPDQVLVRTLIPRCTGIVGVLTGPFTLAKSCVNSYYSTEEDLCFAFAQALAKEAEALSPFVDVLSIDEPWFANELPDYAEEELKVVVDSVCCPTRLHVCGDVASIVPRLLDMPVQILSHEFKASPHLFKAFQDHPGDKEMCIGSVRSDTASVEPVEEIVAHLQRASDVFGSRIVQVAPDCGQRLLPREAAFHKLQNLRQATEVVYGR